MTSRAAALLLAATLAACGDTTGPLADLAGTWDATSAVMTNPANTSESIDLVAEGLGVRFIVSADGTLEARFTEGAITDTDTGTIAVSGSQITVTLDNDPSTGTYLLSGDELTLLLVTGVEWDFDDDGIDEPATLEMVLIRQ